MTLLDSDVPWSQAAIEYRIPGRSESRISSFLLFVANGLELVARFPLWKSVRLRNAIADGHQQFAFFGKAGQIPIGLHLVGGRVIVVVRVFVLLLPAEPGWLADVIDPIVRV